MKQKKKRDKKYTPKPCVKPLGIRDAVKFEMPALAALEALGLGHFQETHVYDMLSCVDLVRRTAPDGDPVLAPAQLVVEAIAGIQRHQVESGKPEVSDEDMALLRQHMGRMISYLRGVPNVEIWRASKAANDEFNRLGALRV
jgi:hypothetical protein